MKQTNENQERKAAVWFVPYGPCNNEGSQTDRGFVLEKSVGLLNIRLPTACCDFCFATASLVTVDILLVFLSASYSIEVLPFQEESI